MVKEIAYQAYLAKKEMQALSEAKKNQVLADLADALIENKEYIILKNKIDLENAQVKEYHSSFLERLTLNEERIISMADGLRALIKIEDPTTEILEVNKRPNGLLITKKVVPLGVIGIIYESRPNVTIDTFALCFKSGNVSILRGGKEAIHSNIALVFLIHQVLVKNNIAKEIVTLIEDTSRENALDLMKQKEYIDLLIPRGGASLIETVKTNSLIPVIETGSGVCHLYVDKEADIEMAIKVAYNAKVQRPAVCNSIETILVHEKVKDIFLKEIEKAFQGVVSIYGTKEVSDVIRVSKLATVDDFKKEYDDFIVNIKLVKDIEEAIIHINQFSSHHSESIITNNDDSAQQFMDDIDSAVVYHNASTRFSDGFEFGYGAEVGISTQKLHARGPMGLTALTTTKYQVYGNGEVRK